MHTQEAESTPRAQGTYFGHGTICFGSNGRPPQPVKDNKDNPQSGRGNGSCLKSGGAPLGVVAEQTAIVALTDGGGNHPIHIPSSCTAPTARVPRAARHPSLLTASFSDCHRTVIRFFIPLSRPVYSHTWPSGTMIESHVKNSRRAPGLPIPGAVPAPPAAPPSPSHRGTHCVMHAAPLPSHALTEPCGRSRKGSDHCGSASWGLPHCKD